MRVREHFDWSVRTDLDPDDALAAMSAVLWDRLALALAIVALGALLALIGCGNDLVVAGALPSPTVTTTGTPGCLPSGDICSLSSDCCSGLCLSPDGVNLICQ